MRECLQVLYSKLYFKGYVIILLVSILLNNITQAQDKCGTVQYQELLQKHRNSPESAVKFESWLQERILYKKIKDQNAMSSFGSEDDLVIPVVIHVIHDGEAEGVGSNISLERIISQIEVLNKDFKRLNSDTIKTPFVFREAAADVQIEFVLAKRDPEGLPTNGVVRKKGSQSQFAIVDNWELKSHSYWPSEDYLNIWVAPLKSNLLGFAQFPQSNTAMGLEEASAYQFTDGVVIDYEYFGINNDVSPASKGRTATHEIGHFLGLRHIWGDGGCEEDDYCEDTPNVDGANYGCPNVGIVSCGNEDMFQNFMDYTDDVCMNIFTKDQKNRIHTVLTDSPRRASLINSKGATSPIIVSNDLGIKKINSPLLTSCNEGIAPEIIVRNYGNNLISSFEIYYSKNGVKADSIYQNVNLDPLDSLKVAFPSILLEETDDVSFSFFIKEVNGSADENLDNNNKTNVVAKPGKTTLPFVENFENEDIFGSLFNPDQQYGWERLLAPDVNPINRALGLTFYDYNNNLGDRDFYFTPLFDLSLSKKPTLVFSYAYSEYSGGSDDGLEVHLSTDCGSTYKKENLLFEGSGVDIATVQRSRDFFTPSGRLEWKQVQIDLSDYQGLENLRISFTGINDFGNNIYLDNIEIIEAAQFTEDLQLLKINIPPVSCTPTVSPEAILVNKGTSTVDKFTVTLSSIWEEDITINYSELSIAPQDTFLVNLPAVTAPYGIHNLSVDLQNPNGFTDDYPGDNTKSVQFVIDSTTESLPLRQNFDSETSNNGWHVFNPDKGTTWEVVETSEEIKNRAIFMNHFDYSAIDEEDWFVSPQLDFNNLDFINLSFSVSYAYNFNYLDRLQVLVSTDCGNNYTSVAYEVSGKDLSETYSSKSWAPEEKINWQKYSLSLDDFIGEENVRIAFVMKNGYGNNLYLDDIEFFISDQPGTEIPKDQLFIFPNPTNGLLPITFNLTQKQPVKLSIYDLRGKRLFSKAYPNTLNQQYVIDVATLPSAVYILKISGESFSDNKRILIQK